jgi:uncharacterized protein DUF4440
MRKTIVACAVVALASAALVVAGQTPAADAASVIDSEKALYAALARRDTAAFQALTLPDGVWTTPSGFVPMGPLSGGLSAFELPAWGIENPHVIWSDGTSALLLYLRTGGGSYDRRPFASTMLASTLWTKRGGKWLAVHHQESEDVQ